MATNREVRATLFECETCKRLFQNMEQFFNHQCDNPASGGFDGPTLEVEDASLDLESEDGGPVELAPDNAVLWTRPATLLLIDMYRENMNLVNSGKLRKKALWSKITAKLNEKGNQFQSQQVEGRWKTLIRGLKNVKDHNKKSGSEKRTHPYEEELSFMAGKPNVNPEYVLSTDTSKSSDASTETTAHSEEGSSSGTPSKTFAGSSKRMRQSSGDSPNKSPK